MRIVKINSIRDAIQNALWCSSGNEMLQYFLMRGAKVTIFAGAVRDLILKMECGWENIEPRDWDIGICGISRKEFDGILRDLGGSKNKYGGFKLFLNGSKAWEVWRQEDTVGLRKTRASFSMANLLRSFVLSCNAIGCDLEKGDIYDAGAIRSIFMCEIAILDDAIMHDQSVFAAKALSLTLRRPLRLGLESRQFINRYLDATNLLHECNKTHLRLSIVSNELKRLRAIPECPTSI